MSKNLIIPDIHGNHKWENFLKINNIDLYDNVYFLGDYFDSWNNNWENNDQLNNFLNICNLSRKNPKVKLLIGNHDLAYLTNNMSVSGHQQFHSIDIYCVLMDNLDLLNIAYCIDNWVISHAGISNSWFRSNVGLDFPHLEDAINVINTMFQNKNFKIFDFIMPNKLSNYYDVSGDDIWQSPTWIRPKSLLKDMKFKKQIVGHTEISDISFFQNEDCKLIICDSPNHYPFWSLILKKNMIMKKLKYKS